jgi:structural maintenance of chromosome 4
MESQSISDEIKSLQQKILDVGGVKLRAIQSKVSTTKGLLDLANDAITKAEVGQAKAQRDVEKLARAIESNTAKLEEVDAELAVVQGDLDAVTGDLASIRAKVQEAVEASGDVQEELASKKKELDEKNGDINKFRKLEMDYKQKIEDGSKMGKDCKRKYEHWRARHEELELVYVE